MNSQIDNELTAILDNAYSEFGFSATWNDVAVVVRVTSRDVRVDSGYSNIPDVSVSVRMSDVARPYPGDTVVIEGTTYAVSDNPTGTTYEWTVDLVEVVA